MEVMISGIETSTTYPVGNSLNDSIQAITQTFNFFRNNCYPSIDSNQEIDIFGRGSSGLIIATLFGTELLQLYPSKTIKVIEIKKEGVASEDCHHCLSSFEPKGLTLFVDDFCSSGDTIEKSAAKVRDTYGSDFCFDYGILCGRMSYMAKIENLHIFKTLIHR